MSCCAKWCSMFTYALVQDLSSKTIFLNAQLEHPTFRTCFADGQWSIYSPTFFSPKVWSSWARLQVLLFICVKGFKWMTIFNRTSTSVAKHTFNFQKFNTCCLNALTSRSEVRKAGFDPWRKLSGFHGLKREAKRGSWFSMLVFFVYMVTSSIYKGHLHNI